MMGENKVIVAIEALGTGVDVGGITDAIHVEKPHGMIIFSQGSGGRRGEKVKSTILMRMKEYERLSWKKIKQSVRRE